MSLCKTPSAPTGGAISSCTRAIVALTLAALGGCSSCPPFRASWYVQEEPGANEQTKLVTYLALLNEGNKKVDLTDVIVNPEGGTILPLTQLTLPTSAKPRGQMVVLPKKKELQRPPEPATTQQSDKDSSSDDPEKRAAARREAERKAAEQNEADRHAANQLVRDQKMADDKFVSNRGKLPATQWLPGELLVFRVRDKDGEDRCSLPVAVQIQCGERCGRTQLVSGAMPNYLHADWLQLCQPLKGTP